MTAEDSKRRIIKANILNYIRTNLKYYVSKSELDKEEKKLFAALKDLFENVPLEQMSDNSRFCENGRFDFLLRKKRRAIWGEKFLFEINDIVNRYLQTN